MPRSVSAPLALFLVALILSSVALVASGLQLTCNKGTFGGLAALSTNANNPKTCDRTSLCYGTAAAAPSSCTYDSLTCHFCTL